MRMSEHNGIPKLHEALTNLSSDDLTTLGEWRKYVFLRYKPLKYTQPQLQPKTLILQVGFPRKYNLSCLNELSPLCTHTKHFY
jgi:hypothetical protein